MTSLTSGVLTVCNEMDQWPCPAPGLTLNLPVMGVVFQVRLWPGVPGVLGEERPFDLCFSDPHSFQDGQTGRKSRETDGAGGQQQVGASLLFFRCDPGLLCLCRTSCRLRLCCPRSTSWTSSGPSRPPSRPPAAPVLALILTCCEVFAGASSRS